MNLTYTENGAAQYSTSGSYCLDLFAEIGSSRGLLKCRPQDVEDLFLNAYKENPKAAAAIVYWVRAIRNGAGERDLFYFLMKVLWDISPQFVRDNLGIIADVGYYKDYVKLFNVIPELEDDIVKIFADAIGSGNVLAYKWIPRHSALYSKVKNFLGISNAAFRRTIASGNTVEKLLCNNEMGKVVYKHVPSLAMNKYKELFLREDRDRFLEAIKEGDIHSDVIFPHDIFRRYWNTSVTPDDIAVMGAQWDNLPDYLNGETVIPVLDVSGSMEWTRCCNGLKPSNIAMPLAIYCAERCGGAFKNKVITFSRKANVVELEGDIWTKVETLKSRCECDNTNLRAVFVKLLDMAKKHGDAIPSVVLLLSDMQFDEGCDDSITVIDELKLQYKYAGYKFPRIVYWNLAATNNGISDDKDYDVAFVSGYSPNVLRYVFSGEEVKKMDPVEVMHKAIAAFEHRLNFDNLVELPKIFAKRDFNLNRGHSCRINDFGGSAFICLEDDDDFV